MPVTQLISDIFRVGIAAKVLAKQVDGAASSKQCRCVQYAAPIARPQLAEVEIYAGRISQ